jgi:SPX domain protein involved in polyphosphate accumulation
LPSSNSDYDGLKRQLKEGTAKGKFTDQDEAAFIEFMERELEKVASFRHLKADELERRVEYCESTVQAILSANPSIAGVVGSPIPGNPAEDSLLASVRKDISRISAETAELSKFTRLNYTGFLKVWYCNRWNE